MKRCHPSLTLAAILMQSCPSVPDETWYCPEHILCRAWLTVHRNNKPAFFGETWFNDSSYMYIHVHVYIHWSPTVWNTACTHCIHVGSNMYMHFNQISNTGFEALYHWMPSYLFCRYIRHWHSSLQCVWGYIQNVLRTGDSTLPVNHVLGVVKYALRCADMS